MRKKRLKDARRAPRGVSLTQPFSITIVPDADWVAYALTLRERLESRLADPSNLTPSDVTEIVARLVEIAARLRAFDRATGVATCRAKVAADAIAVAEIVVGSDGRLSVTCSGPAAGA